jgi:hypothetical protein
MTRRLSFSPYAIGLAVAIAGATTQFAFARGGRGGGFSRESPAASGSFSSRSGAMQGRFRRRSRRYRGSRSNWRRDRRRGGVPSGRGGRDPDQ